MLQSFWAPLAVALISIWFAHWLEAHDHHRK